MDEIRLLLFTTDAANEFSLIADDVFMFLLEKLSEVNHAFKIVDHPGKHYLSRSVGLLTNGKHIDETENALQIGDAFYRQIFEVIKTLQFNCV